MYKKPGQGKNYPDPASMVSLLVAVGDDQGGGIKREDLLGSHDSRFGLDLVEDLEASIAEIFVVLHILSYPFGVLRPFRFLVPWKAPNAIYVEYHINVRAGVNVAFISNLSLPSIKGVG